MSLQFTLDSGVPRETAAVAHAAFPRGHTYLKLRDALDPIYADRQFADLFARVGQPAACPWRLALITLLQFSENLSDRRAADAVRARIDWSCLLGLDLSDPGFDASVLSEFRSRLVAGGAEALLFDTLLTLCRERGLLAKRGRQRTDAIHVLGAVRSLNRLGCAIETLRAALNALAIVAPGWLRAYTVKPDLATFGHRSDSMSYPSGHATFGYLAATVLSRLVPEKRRALFAFAASYGENRMIAGTHFPSGLEAGKVAAAVIAEVLFQDPRFERDLTGASAENAAKGGTSGR